MTLATCASQTDKYENHHSLINLARLAQSVERLALNQVVVGSSPTVGVHFFEF